MWTEVFADATLAAPLSCSLGVAIKNNGETRHIGILLNDHGVGMILHLAWHKDVRFERVDPTYFWIPTGLPSEDVMAISEALVAAAANQPSLSSVSYSPLYEGSYFLGNSLHYVRNEPGHGLTCATFVLAVFDSFGYNLIDANQWPVRDEDEQWRDNVIENLKQHPRTSTPQEMEEHIRAILTHPSAIRFRPEEVAASVAATKLPMGFMDAENEGMKILKQI